MSALTPYASVWIAVWLLGWALGHSIGNEIRHGKPFDAVLRLPPPGQEERRKGARIMILAPLWPVAIIPVAIFAVVAALVSLVRDGIPAVYHLWRDAWGRP